MTRGRIAIISPEGKILTSVEFNGNMDFGGYGEEMFDSLDAIETVEDYTELVERFNEENFQYDEELFYEVNQNYLDLKDDYFGKWFSDYIYIKNFSNKPVVFTTADDKRIALDSDYTAVFNFGEFIASDSKDFEKAHFLDTLKELKENLDYDAQSNYSQLWNTCADYDNNHRGSYLTDRIMEHDFVDEETLQYIIKDQSECLSRLRCFIGDTYDADIYMLDGYGNLKNVETEDFEEVIDDLIYDLRREITVPYAKSEISMGRRMEMKRRTKLSEYEDMLTIKDLCEFLQISANTAYKFIEEGTVKVVRVGREYKISSKSLAQFLGLA